MDRAMLKYVYKLTVQPGDVCEQDVAALRDEGFSDAAIGDIAINCALFAFFTRIVDGLGATLEPNMPAEAERIGLTSHLRPAPA
jgi:alkylhydroperoxidase family enzyme